MWTIYCKVNSKFLLMLQNVCLFAYLHFDQRWNDVCRIKTDLSSYVEEKWMAIHRPVQGFGIENKMKILDLSTYFFKTIVSCIKTLYCCLLIFVMYFYFYFYFWYTRRDSNQINKTLFDIFQNRAQLNLGIYPRRGRHITLIAYYITICIHCTWYFHCS